MRNVIFVSELIGPAHEKPDSPYRRTVRLSKTATFRHRIKTVRGPKESAITSLCNHTDYYFASTAGQSVLLCRFAFKVEFSWWRFCYQNQLAREQKLHFALNICIWHDFRSPQAILSPRDKPVLSPPIMPIMVAMRENTRIPRDYK